MTDAVLAPRPLDEVLAQLQSRGLALRRGVEPEAGRPRPMRPALPTGQPRLDEALGTGGWPRGALVGLDAPAGHGATTLALGSLAACQAAGGLVAWIDAAGSLGSFDPGVAERLGVRLEWCLVARPHDAAEALELAAWLARSRLIDAFVLDAAGLTDARAGGMARGLDRLADLLARTGSVGLLLRGGRAAGVRVALAREAWLAAGRDLVGQRVAAEVTRHRWALAGGRATLDLWFAEGRRIDALLRAGAVPRDGESDGVVERIEQPKERPALRVLSA